MVSWKYNLHSVAWNPFPIDHLPILFFSFQPNSNSHNHFSNYCCSDSSVVKEFAFKCRRRRFNSWVRKIPWSRKWQPTPVFLPGKFHGQRSLAGYSPWGHKESDTTEHTAHRTSSPLFWIYTHTQLLSHIHPMDCGPSGSSVHWVLQAIILE